MTVAALDEETAIPHTYLIMKSKWNTAGIREPGAFMRSLTVEHEICTSQNSTNSARTSVSLPNYQRLSRL